MWQVKGQDRTLALLDHALKEGNVAHAYLLVGPPHVGKRTLALDLACALNCDDPGPPCGGCRSCRRIIEGKHADVVTLDLHSRTEIGIDDIRGLHHLAHLPPYEGSHKVFIIEDAEYMSTEAANSLLKILEEPPPQIIWLLLAVEEARLLPTIISRCQRLELRPVPRERIESILVASCGVQPDRAGFLARLSDGCLGWALSAISDDSLLDRRSREIDRLSSLLTAGFDQRFAFARDLAAQFGQNRRAAMETMATWLAWWRDLMLISSGCKSAIISVDYEQALEGAAKSLDLGTIKDFIARLYLAREEVLRNVSPRLAFDALMLDLPRLKATND